MVHGGFEIGRGDPRLRECGNRRLDEPVKGNRRGGRPAHGDRAVGDLDIGRRRLQQRARRCHELVAHPARRHVNGAARVHRAPRGEGAHAERNGRGVPTHHGDPVERNAEDIGGDLGEGRLVSLSLAAGAGGHHRAPRGVEPHRGALVRPDGRAFHVAGEADAAIHALGAQLLLLCAKRVIAHGGQRRFEARLEVSAVVDEPVAIAIRQVDLVGQVGGGEIVPASEVCGIHGERAGEAVYDAIHG